MSLQRLEILHELDEMATEMPPDIDAYFNGLLAEIGKHERVIIAGGPRAGKSTLAAIASERFGMRKEHADRLIRTHEWGDDSQEISTWFDRPGKWIVEGVSIPRAIRKYHANNPGKSLGPSILVVYMPSAIQLRTEKQESMTVGIDTVFREVYPVLKAANVPVIGWQEPAPTEG